MTTANVDPAPLPDFDGTQACAGTDDGIWFPDASDAGSTNSTQRRVVETYCSGCDFRRPCLAYALTNNVQGWWAGTSSEDRRRIRKEHGIAAPPVEAGGGVDDQVLAMSRARRSAAKISVATGVTTRTVTRIRTRHRKQP